MGDHIVILARIAQEIPVVCDLKLEIEGTRLLATQQYYSIKTEREGDCTKAELGKQHPCIET